MTSEGPRFEREKVYSTMGPACPLGCIYCFVDVPGYRNPSSLNPLHSQELLKFRDTIGDGAPNGILPTHDVEIFLIKGWADKLLRLATLGKHMLFSTKLPLDRGAAPRGDKRIAVLQEVDGLLKEGGTMLHPSVSIPRWDRTETIKIEPSLSSPQERADTAQMLFRAGLATSVSIRPTLPFVSEEEYAALIDTTAAYCDYYLTSPLYLTPAMKEYMEQEHPGYNAAEVEVGFMGGLAVEAVNTSEAAALITTLAAKRRTPVFDRSEFGISHSMRLRKT